MLQKSRQYAIIKLMKLKKYRVLFKNHLATVLEYRSEILFGVILELVGFVGIILYWTAVYKDTSSVGSYNLGSMLAYYLILPLIYMFTGVNFAQYLGEDIKSGVLANQLLKPFYTQIWYISRMLARRVINLVLVVPFLLLPLFFLNSQGLFTPTIMGIGTCMLLMVFSLFLYSSLEFCIGYLAFWVDDVWAFRHIKEIVIGTLGGMMFPLAIVQDKVLMGIINALPFRFIYYTPLNYLLGKADISQLGSDLQQMLTWSLVFIILATILWKQGLKKYEAYGR